MKVTACLYTGKTSRTTEQIFMKFYINLTKICEVIPVLVEIGQQ